MGSTGFHHFSYSTSTVQSPALLYFCHSYPEKSPNQIMDTLFLHLDWWVLLERMDTGFCDLGWRQIQVIQAFLGSLWCGNLDDRPLKSSSFHPSQMLSQSLSPCMRWDLPHNLVLPQFLPSPQLHQSCPFPSCLNRKANSLSLRPVFSPFSLWSPHPSASSATMYHQALCHLHINGLISYI